MDMEQEFIEEMVESKNGWALFDGETFTGWPVRTIVRCETVMADGDILAEKEFGEFVPRESR